MAIRGFDKTNLKTLNKLIASALKPLADELELEIKVGNEIIRKIK